LRIRHEILLDLGIGEYTFEVGLATLSRMDYIQRSALSHDELTARVIRICHVPNVAVFQIKFRKKGLPVQLLHHGIANLPGHCDIWLHVQPTFQ